MTAEQTALDQGKQLIETRTLPHWSFDIDHFSFPDGGFNLRATIKFGNEVSTTTR